MRIRLTQIDGKLPNLALMRLGYYHRKRGDEVVFSRSVRRSLFERPYDRVYGSAIFTFSRRRLDLFRHEFPEAVIGGTGSGSYETLESLIPDIGRDQSYEDYPECDYSLGFLHRGCRLRCRFCVVPATSTEANPTRDTCTFSIMTSSAFRAGSAMSRISSAAGSRSA